MKIFCPNCNTPITRNTIKRKAKDYDEMTIVLCPTCYEMAIIHEQEIQQLKAATVTRQSPQYCKLRKEL